MPHYGPHEDAYTQFLEKTLLGEAFISSVGYGIILVLYVLSVLRLWQECKRRGGIMLFLLAYVTLLFGLSTLWVGAGVWTTEDLYINNRNYPEGPWAYFLATQNLPENVAFIVAFFILTFLSDLLMLWRCWVIWTSASKLFAYTLVALPLLALLSSLALGMIWCLNSSQPGRSLYSKVSITLGTSYTVTSLSVNIVVTLLIIGRLVVHRRATLDILPPEHAKQYISIAAIFVESATLYSVFALGFIITYAINNPMNQIFLAVSPTCQQVAGYLIILRLAQGRAWDTNTLSATSAGTPQLSTV